MAQTVESACNARDSGSIPGSGRSSREGNGYPLQHSCLENPHGQSLCGLPRVDEWKRLIDTYASAGVTQFSFTGGEALLKEGCLELMDFASKRAQAGLRLGRLVLV